MGLKSIDVSGWKRKVFIVFYCKANFFDDNIWYIIINGCKALLLGDSKDRCAL